jgi:hypothetical protein
MNDLFNKIVRIVQGIYALTLKQLGHKKGAPTFLPQVSPCRTSAIRFQQGIVFGRLPHKSGAPSTLFLASILLSRADQTLYKAKRSGRNCTCFAPAPAAVFEGIAQYTNPTKSFPLED